MVNNILIIPASSCGELARLLFGQISTNRLGSGRRRYDELRFLMIVTIARGGTKMRRTYTRQQVVQTRSQIDELQDALMIWFPAGFAFLELILHIFPKITLPI
jgi:hypothetical protein